MGYHVRSFSNAQREFYGVMHFMRTVYIQLAVAVLIHTYKMQMPIDLCTNNN